MKFLCFLLAALLFSAPLHAYPCAPRRTHATPCKPETLRIEKEVIHKAPCKQPFPAPIVIQERHNPGPWIALAGFLVAGAILAHEDGHDRHYITVSTGGKKHDFPCKDGRRK